MSGILPESSHRVGLKNLFTLSVGAPSIDSALIYLRDQARMKDCQ